MDIHLVVGFVVASALIAIVPGQDMLFIISNAVVGGRRAGLLAALGMSTGLVVHTVTAALGLTALIAAAPTALQVIRWAGAAVLLYFAVSTWRASRRTLVQSDLDEMAVPRRSLRRLYGMAVLTNIANPKVIIFYLAFVPQFLTTGGAAWSVAPQLLVLGAILIVVGLAIDGTAGLLAGVASERIRRHRKVRCWLERASAAVFGALAVRLVADNR